MSLKFIKSLIRLKNNFVKAFKLNIQKIKTFLVLTVFAVSSFNLSAQTTSLISA